MDAQLHALPTLAVLARTVSGCLHSAFFGLGSGSGLLTRPSLRPQLFRARPRARHLETFGPPEDEGRERPHRIGNKTHEELMRRMPSARQLVRRTEVGSPSLPCLTSPGCPDSRTNWRALGKFPGARQLVARSSASTTARSLRAVRSWGNRPQRAYPGHAPYPDARTIWRAPTKNAGGEEQGW